MGGRLTSADPTSDICPYELAYFAEKHGIADSAAEVILRINGPSRYRCDHAAAAYLQVMHLGKGRKKPPARNIKA